MDNREPVLVADRVGKKYATAAEILSVLHDISFELHAGETVSIIGESGTGKSTLLNLIGGLDYVSSGRISVFGTDIGVMNETGLARFRNRNIGFVFQYHHLLPDLNALENAALPALLAGLPRAAALQTARELLVRCGLAGRMEHRPAQLSGGEQQRVAIARALINRPGLVLMDEPTGNLDEETGREVLEMIAELQQQHGLTLVVVTHNPAVAAGTERCLRLSHGSADFVVPGGKQ